MDAAARAGLARRLRLEPSLAVLVAAFVATLFLSALLLFSVQPMFARMVLPRLGGSPSVWAVSMCFFQATLLAGYAYAHLLNRLAAPRFAPALHLLLLGAAVLALPVGVPAEWSEPPPGNAYLWLMCLLAVGVGLPFFGVSANAPLLQSWFSQSGHPQAADPYFLYGASNLGSLVALLAYPVLIEPFAGLSTQAAMWAVGFIGLGLLIAGCGLLTVARDASASVLAHAERTQRVEIGWQQRAHWIALSFVPSGLLVAFTTYVTTDIASAPFLWVLPLALFLGTFILVFRDKPVIPHSAMLLVQPILVAAVLFGISTAGNRGWMIASVAGTLAFFVTTMVCHKELYDRRPPSQHLTEFYFWMSLGGVLGGMFAALAAPQLFNAIWEYPLLLVLGMALRPGALQRTQAAEGLELAAIAIAMLAVMIGIGAASSELISSSQAELSRIFIIVGCGSLAFLNTGKPLRQLVFIAIAALAILVLPSAMSRGTAERSFFGTHRVTMTTDGKTRLLMHGTTIHGAERIIDQAGKPAAAPVPATYYYPASPMARGVGVARDIAARNGHGARIGIVGLGAGSMACHARSQEAWRFYEIDPVVAKIARDPSRFRFLAHCRPDADIVIGDARLTLAKEKDASFDYLVIDAFSSDSVPVHLMTVEAVRLYLRKLTPDGLLALHVSNRHLDLVSVAGAVARALPGTHAVLADDRAPERGFDAASSYVVFMSRSAEALQPVRAWQDVRPIEAGKTAAWTDDYSNILSALWRKYRHKH